MKKSNGKYAWQDSNLRPTVPETVALSSELQAPVQFRSDFFIPSAGNKVNKQLQQVAGEKCGLRLDQVKGYVL